MWPAVVSLALICLAGGFPAEAFPQAEPDSAKPPRWAISLSGGPALGGFFRSEEASSADYDATAVELQPGGLRLRAAYRWEAQSPWWLTASLGYERWALQDDLQDVRPGSGRLAGLPSPEPANWQPTELRERLQPQVLRLGLGAQHLLEWGWADFLAGAELAGAFPLRTERRRSFREEPVEQTLEDAALNDAGRPAVGLELSAGLRIPLATTFFLRTSAGWTQWFNTPFDEAFLDGKRLPWQLSGQIGLGYQF